MTQRTTSGDEEFVFNFEYIDTASSVPGQNSFHDVSPSFQLVQAFRSQSFGEQFLAPPDEQLLVPPGGRRRRAQSHNPSFPSIVGLHTADHDTFALADDYPPSLDFSPIASPLSEPTSTQWDFTHQRDEFAHSTLSSFPSPEFLSPRLEPGSDSSSVLSSMSPSPTHSRFVDPAFLSPNPESVSLRYASGSPDPPDRGFPINIYNEPCALGDLRGRLARRRERHKPPDLPIESSGRVLSFERLSIQDETSTEQSYGVSPYYPYSAPHDSQPEFRLRADELSLTSNSSTDGSSIYPCSTPASFGPSGVGNFHDGFEGSSSDAGSSRSHSHSHLPVFDADHLAASHNNSDDRRQVARAYRRRQLSPYPAAGPSTGQEEGGNTAYWTAGSPGGASTDAFPDHGLHLPNTQDLHTLSPTAADADGSSGGNTDQSSQRDSGYASGYRHSVATDATRRTVNVRRKDPTKIGAHICPYCGNDFTALHNLNYHIKSHLSLKEHPCKDCGQRFGTPQVLKRHKRKCRPVSLVSGAAFLSAKSEYTQSSTVDIYLRDKPSSKQSGAASTHEKHALQEFGVEKNNQRPTENFGWDKELFEPLDKQFEDTVTRSAYEHKDVIETDLEEKKESGDRLHVELFPTNSIPPSLIEPAVTPSASLSGLQQGQQMVTMNSESGNYYCQLLRQRRGFPLYVPRDVAIGDVGRLTPEGIFEVFFNIYNANIPEDLVPFSSYNPIDVFNHEFDAGDNVSSPSVRVDSGFPAHMPHSSAEIKSKYSSVKSSAPGGDFVFSCRGPNGAVLALPHGAHQEKLKNLEGIRRYAAKQAQSWYKYVNETRGRGLANGSLYLATGWEKARSWGMASFHDVSLQNDFQVSFRPTAGADDGYRYRWHAPYCHRKYADPPTAKETPLNQTIFIHAFAISLCDGIWRRLFGDTEISRPMDNVACSFVPYGFQESKSCTVRVPVIGNGILSEAFPIPAVFHPSQIIHERILREAPEAKVVITHDDDWRDVFGELHENSETAGQSLLELQQAIFDHFEIVEEDGAAFLTPKSRTTMSGNGPAVALGEQCQDYGRIIADGFDNSARLLMSGPLNQSIRKDEETQKLDPTGRGTVFALVIGIDEYMAKNDLHPLRGAVNDAKAISQYLLDLRVPSSNIISLENEKATRATILSTFKSHFIDNQAIPDRGEATMIFFFAGHGCRVQAPGSILPRDVEVETICPVDERTINDAGEYVHAIPDYVLGWLLWELAEKKKGNITVILDSCHSGGMGRDVGMGRAANSDSRSLPPDLDSHLWSDRTNAIHSHRMRSQTATSHVLLAACRENETAREVKYKNRYYGRFTRNLVKALRRASLKNTTYEQLIGRTPQWSGQTPQCGGIGKDRLIFNGNYPTTGQRSVLLIPSDADDLAPNTNLFRVDMGTVAGVIPGTEFYAYDEGNDFLCTLVAQSVLSDHSIVIGKDQRSVNIPRGSQVVISDWMDSAMILRVHIPADFQYKNFLFPMSQPARPPKFVQAVSLEDAHIIVQIDQDRDEVVIEPRTPTMLWVQEEARFPLGGKPAHLLDAIDGVAHFNYFLDRANHEDPIKGFALEMHRLKGEHPNREPDQSVGRNGNLVKDGAVDVTWVEHAMYGFTVRNDFTEDLFPYLFYFDPETYTIELWYGRFVRVPLKTGQALTIGMGIQNAFKFSLRDGRLSRSGFLKLFVTGEFCDLDWIQQTMSPFDLQFEGTGRLEMGKEKFDKMTTWDALTVTLKMTAS